MNVFEKHMQRALELAKKAGGKTSPNPLVGCVIVKAGKVIAEGWHRVYGGDHAEVDALKKAGTRARGAVMVVTLEPCHHWGRTPPCVDAVIAAGIKKVVIAMTDPNPLTRGKSVRKLRASGIEVETGLLEDEARKMNRFFIKSMTRHLPYVIVKTAQTLDGRIATRSGNSKWITSDGARQVSRCRRSLVDAILVGVNTVLADDPGLDAPGKSVYKIILDSRARISRQARLLKNATPGKVIIVVTDNAPKSRTAWLRRQGVEVLTAPSLKGRVDLKYLLKELARRRITSVLVEGGAAVIGSFFKAGLVDEWHVYLAPRLIGDDKARPSVVGLEPLKIAKAMVFKMESLERLDHDNIFLRFVVH